MQTEVGRLTGKSAARHHRAEARSRGAAEAHGLAAGDERTLVGGDVVGGEGDARRHGEVLDDGLDVRAGVGGRQAVDEDRAAPHHRAYGRAHGVEDDAEEGVRHGRGHRAGGRRDHDHMQVHADHDVEELGRLRHGEPHRRGAHLNPLSGNAAFYKEIVLGMAVLLLFVLRQHDLDGQGRDTRAGAQRRAARTIIDAQASAGTASRSCRSRRRPCVAARHALRPGSPTRTVALPSAGRPARTRATRPRSPASRSSRQPSTQRAPSSAGPARVLGRSPCARRTRRSRGQVRSR